MIPVLILTLMMMIPVRRHSCEFFVCPSHYAGDCGSQISWTGLLESSVKESARLEETFVRQSWRLDTVEISY